jgi:hypothetical protein
MNYCQLLVQCAHFAAGHRRRSPSDKAAGPDGRSAESRSPRPVVVVGELEESELARMRCAAAEW